MFIAQQRPCRRVVLLGALFVATGLHAARADEPNEFERIVSEKGPALVTIKFVLKIRGGGFDRERESEITGIMIDPKGMVLCSNTQIGGAPGMFRRFGGSAKPKDIKILVGDDTEGVKAKLVAKDSELDLAWLQVTQPPETDYAFVDLTKTATVAVGQRVLALGRLGKYFDRTAVISEGRIGGITSKPRDLYVPATSFVGGFGVPIFNPAGEFVGVTVIQMPDTEDGAMQSGATRGGRSGLILPAADVARATKLAKEAAAEDDEEE